VFVSVNATDGKGRKVENVTRIRAVVMDWDEGTPLALIATLHPAPHIVVESSPGKAHAYFCVSDCALAEFKPMQQALAARHGADRSVCDLPRVLRLPGFVHQKGVPFLTRLVSTTDTPPYTLVEIKAGLLQDGRWGADPGSGAANRLAASPRGQNPGGDIEPGSGYREHRAEAPGQGRESTMERRADRGGA
jgi:hypothetical protein